MFTQFSILCALNSFGVSYLEPYIPVTNFNTSISYFIHSIWKRENRSDFLNTKRPKEQPRISRKWKYWSKSITKWKGEILMNDMQKLGKVEAMGLSLAVISNNIIFNMTSVIFNSCGSSSWLNVLYVSILSILFMLVCNISFQTFYKL